jgi:thioesterase domain-containing protein
MGMKVKHYDGQSLTLAAPLELNLNDKLTAFGGSLYNMAVMTAWGMVYLKTQEAGIVCNQVVTQGNINYLMPVTDEIISICHAPEQKIIDQFLNDFYDTGKGKIKLSSTILSHGKTAVEFQGQYAILKLEKDSKVNNLL